MKQMTYSVAMVARVMTKTMTMTTVIPMMIASTTIAKVQRRKMTTMMKKTTLSTTGCETSCERVEETHTQLIDPVRE